MRFFSDLCCRTWILPWLVFVVLAGTALRQTSCTYDEAVYAKGVRLPHGRLPFEDNLINIAYPYAEWVLFHSSGHGDSILEAARYAVLIPFSLLLFTSLWLWAKALTDRLSSQLAVWLAAGSPSLLAHAGVVSDDFACAASWVAWSWGLYRFLRNPSLRAGCLLGLLTGLALACKFTSLFLLPVLGIGLIWKVAAAPMGSRRAFIRHGLMAVLIALSLTALLYGWPLGLGRYVEGVVRIYRNVNPHYKTYFFGVFYDSPPLLYFPCTLLLKESMLLLLGGAAGVLLLRGLHDRLAFFSLLAPIVVLMAVVFFDRFGFGVRRVLPIAAFLPIFSAVAWHWIAPRLSRPLFWGGALVLFQLGSAWVAWPNYLSYFNPASRLKGPPLVLLDDSNLDWGQDLKALKKVLHANGIEKGFICYFGGVDPAYYGISLKEISMSEAYHPSQPGFYAISAQYLIRLRQHDPALFPASKEVARAGDSIYIFKQP